MTDQTTKTNPLIRFWRALLAILLTPVQTLVIGLLAAGLVIFAGGAYLFNRQADSDAADRAEQQRASDLDAYNVAHDNWRESVAGYQSCIVTVDGAVETNQKLRTLFAAIVDLSDVLPGVATAEAYTVSKTSLIDVLYPPVDGEARKLERCEPIKPGPEPVDPRGD